MTSLRKLLDNGVEPEALRLDLWQRSANSYQQAGALLKAAAAWLNAGDRNTAAELFAAADDDFRAAELFYDCGRFSAAVSCAERCRKNLAELNFFQRVTISLVQAAALLKLDQAAAASRFLQAARIELNRFSADSPKSRFQAGRAWESLARCGARMERPDLIRLGFEKALLLYGPYYNLERLRSADNYLNLIIDDKILAADLKDRIAGFKCEFDL